MATLANILADVSYLTDKDKENLLEFLKRIFTHDASQHGNLIGELRENKFTSGYHCRHCGSVSVVRYGKRNGRQRYKCKDCFKISNDLTNTPLYRSKKANKWITFIECMLKGLSLRESAKIVGVHFTTCFYWRHKLLSALARQQTPTFEGIVEADETYFLESRKGRNILTDRKSRKRAGSATKRGISSEQVCVLIAKDRNKNTLSKVVGMGRILTQQLDENLTHLLQEDAVLCSDAHSSYKSYSKGNGIQHIIINASKKEHVKRGIYHINNINNYHSRLKKWIRKFNGVSTKYLQLYLIWFQFLENREMEADLSKKKRMLFLACILGTWETTDSLRLRAEAF
ncbi:IS1595 family transposase [Bacillus sp. 2205SS5-2]|uniref:IS1595 family transposase n=1 Tax=Bacillus sp. 2205SS5-2 TaxID=3109031 RepID=UPI003003C6C8